MSVRSFCVSLEKESEKVYFPVPIIILSKNHTMYTMYNAINHSLFFCIFIFMF